MPLINCPHCKHKVSEDALTCPNCNKPILVLSDRACEKCGERLQKRKRKCSECGHINITKTKNMNKQNNNLLLLLIAILILVGGYFYLNSEEETSNETVNEYYEAEKTETEVYIEAGLEAVNIIGDGLKQKRINDSIKRANKEQVWVYQIGLSKNNVDEIWPTYKVVKNITSNITVFKDSRKSYYIVKNDGLGKDKLLIGLNAFKSEIDSVETIIKVVNLSKFCPLRKEISSGKKIKIKKAKTEIECLVCD